MTMAIFDYKHTYIYISTNNAYDFFVYIPRAIWTIQHLTETLAFKHHWPHDRHDVAERMFFIIIITSWKLKDAKGNRTQVTLMIISELNPETLSPRP